MTRKITTAPVVTAPVSLVKVDAPVAPVAPVESSAFGVQALADAVGASPKDVRRWLRSQTRSTLGRAGAADVLPGKGGRYAFTQDDIDAYARAYGRAKGAKGTRLAASLILGAPAE